MHTATHVCAAAALLGACADINVHRSDPTSLPKPDAGIDSGIPALPAADSVSCGKPLASSAPASITIAGSAVKARFADITPATGASVSVFRAGMTMPLATSQVGTDGSFAISVATAGVPIDGYLRIRLAGYVDTIEYPAVPWYKSVSDMRLTIVDAPMYDAVRGTGGRVARADLAVLVAKVIDCEGHALAGATVSVEPGGQSEVIYMDAQSGYTATQTSSHGIAFVRDIAPETVRIDGAASSHGLRGYQLEAHVDALVGAYLSP
jgi:hypothetical protein